MVFSFQGERVFHVNLCVLVCDYACYLFSHPTGFRNKVLFPTSGIRALVQVGAMTGEDGKTSGIEKFDGTEGIGKCRLKIMFGISLLQAHTSMTMKKKKIYDDLSQITFALIKVELFQKE